MDDQRLNQLERRMEELDQRESAMEKALDSAMARSRAAMGMIVPSETRRHMRASWRHNLLAVRSMIDQWAERLDDGTDDDTAAAKGSTARDTGRENIPID
jgi:type II secretory pathway component PulJ